MTHAVTKVGGQCLMTNSVYVNVVCFDVGCLSFNMKSTKLGLTVEKWRSKTDPTILLLLLQQSIH